MARKEKNWVRAGAEFELMIMDDLHVYGFITQRSSGSRGAADVIAFGPGEGRPELLLIQAKMSEETIPPAERRSLLDLARRSGGVPVTASRLGGAPVYRELTGQGPKEWIPFRPRRTWDDTLRGIRGIPLDRHCELPPRHRGRHWSP